MNITIMGAGYVGLVTGACLSEFGYKITIIDVDKEKVKKINRKESPIYEKDLEEILKKNNIKASVDYKDGITNAEIIFICVGTPTKDDNSQDLTYVKNVCIKMCKYLHKDQIVVVKSSVVPSTTEKIIIPLLEEKSSLIEGKDFHIAVNPEFLKEGSAVKDFMHPDRIIIGYKNNVSKIVLESIYKKFNCPKIFVNPTTAEMIKYASNAFLATKISFINEIGNICKKLGINVYDVADGMGHDKRIGRSFLNAGAGWGGSCFPKDINALISKAKEYNIDPVILESVVKVNEYQPLKIIELLKKHISILKDKKIGILGGAFKPETDDIRESRTIPLIKALLKEKAIIKLYDPKAIKNFKKLFPNIKYCSVDEVIKSDAIIIMTKWKEFEKLNYKSKIVIDGRKIDKAIKESKIYEGVCW